MSSINYSEYFKNRFTKHDSNINEILKEHKCQTSRKKRNYFTAFNQLPPYTRFTDALTNNNNVFLVDTNVLKSPSSP
jgi:hypothetical protein